MVGRLSPFLLGETASCQVWMRDSFHNWRCRGIAEGVRYRGVLQFSWIDGDESQFTKWC